MDLRIRVDLGGDFHIGSAFISGGGDLDRERSGQRFHSVWIQLNYHILVDLPGDLDQNNKLYQIWADLKWRFTSVDVNMAWV